MSSATLVSLAMLKVHVDQRKDYLDYLKPFVLQVLCDHTSNAVTDAVVRDHIREDFGLELPTQAIQLVLKRLARKKILSREEGEYKTTKELTSPNIDPKREEAKKHIVSVVESLMDFSKNTPRPISTEKECVDTICAFLSEFNIQCLRAYLRKTTIPEIENHDNSLIVLVSKFVIKIQEEEPKLFESFMVVAKGHMLANALLCPDLSNAPKSYKNVTFYLDTPLLIRLLGLEGNVKSKVVKDLLELLLSLNGTIITFSHTRDELKNVIREVVGQIWTVC